MIFTRLIRRRRPCAAGPSSDSLQHAVDAEAHAQLAAVGLEVDVRGAALDRLGDDLS